MSFIHLIQRSLAFYWRSHVAVLVCVATGTAVLTGALLVGDSMRGSLLELSLARLGRVDYVIQPARFFRQGLADEIQAGLLASHRATSLAQAVHPAILLRGNAAAVDSAGQETSRAGRVQILGVEEPFWSLARSDQPPDWAAEWGKSGDAVALNETLADELGVKVGDTILLRFEKPSEVPREAVLGRKDDLIVALRRTVSRIIAAHELGNFQLESKQQFTRNAFLPLGELAQSVDLPDRANVLLVQGVSDVTHAEAAESERQWWQGALAARLTLDDIGLRLREYEDRGYLSLESVRMVLEDTVVSAAEGAAESLNVPIAATLSYLANSLTLVGSEPSRSVPYSIVAALPLDVAPPLGPVPFESGDVPKLAADEIVLNTWAAEDLGAKQGDLIEITYFLPDPAYPFETGQAQFRMRGVVPIRGVAADPELVPDYPGITNAEDYADWDPPFPMNLRLVRDKDEEYWDEYRTAPKGFVSLAAGERIWGSRFGQWTSLRVAMRDETKSRLAEKFSRALVERLDPERMGFVVQPVKARAVAASRGGTDFAGLFIGFSFFLIASAAILIALVFRLGVERRAKQLGLLAAIGLRPIQLAGLLVGEAAIVAAMGSLIGVAGGIGYAGLMIAGLRTWWRPAVGTSMLELHAEPSSLVIGALAGLVLTLVAIVLGLRGMTRISPRALLAGATTESIGLIRRRPRRARVLGWSTLIVALAFTGYGLARQASPAMFFGAGALLLVACLSFLWVWLSGTGGRVQGRGAAAVARLGARNGARHRGRSVLTAGLVASATFVIVAVAASRRSEDSHPLEKASGTGGFAALAESDLPLLHDLNSADGRIELAIPDAVAEQLDRVRTFALRLRPGEDASCLNLYKPTQPRILGVPPALIERGGFSFNQVIGDAGEINPWQLLERELPSGAIPAIGDANTVRWILQLGVGEQLSITAENGGIVPLEIVATVSGSIFQSELLISEANFLKFFPDQAGYSYFLVEPAEATGADEAVAVTLALEQSLSDYGFDAVSTAERLAEYHQVENTYLSTFQVVGGLGLVLGTFGLAAVLVRSVLERRGELALLVAVGYRPRSITWLVLAENVLLLLAGLMSGVVSALVAVAPAVLERGADLPWGSLAGTLLLVFAVGMAAAAIAVAGSLRAPLLPALREE